MSAMQTTNGNGQASTFDRFRGMIINTLPPTIDREKVLKQAFYALRATPALAKCTPASWAEALMRAHQLGLEPGLVNEFWLIPRENRKKKCHEVSWQLGYAGLRKMAMRSGRYTLINAQLVFEHDEFALNLATGDISHCPRLTGDRGNLLGAYSVARTREGETSVEWMSVEDIDRIRDQHSEAAKRGYGPWMDHYGEMARKTVLRRHCKQLELSPEDMRALDEDGKQDLVAEVVQQAVKAIPVNSNAMLEVAADYGDIDMAMDVEVEPEPVAQAEPKKPAKKAKAKPKSPIELMIEAAGDDVDARISFIAAQASIDESEVVQHLVDKFGDLPPEEIADQGWADVLAEVSR